MFGHVHANSRRNSLRSFCFELELEIVLALVGDDGGLQLGAIFIQVLRGERNIRLWVRDPRIPLIAVPSPDSNRTRYCPSGRPSPLVLLNANPPSGSMAAVLVIFDLVATKTMFPEVSGFPSASRTLPFTG